MQSFKRYKTMFYMLLGRPYIVLEHALSASRLSLFETAPGVDGFVSPYHYQPRKILDIAL
jgi:hypothetical protein